MKFQCSLPLQSFLLFLKFVLLNHGPTNTTPYKCDQYLEDCLRITHQDEAESRYLYGLPLFSHHLEKQEYYNIRLEDHFV